MTVEDEELFVFLGPGCQQKVGILDLYVVMFMSVIGHVDVLWQNGWTDRDAIWHVGGVGHSHQVLDGGPDPPMVRRNFGGYPPPLKNIGIACSRVFSDM